MSPATLSVESSELTSLRAALDRVRDERSPQLVTLVGVPGIGKSRLLHELSRIVDAEPELITWRQGRCLAYGDGVTFWALAEIVKAQAGVLEADSEITVAEKLQPCRHGRRRPRRGRLDRGPSATARRDRR